MKIAYKSLAKRTRAISNAMPSISLQSRRKNLVIASRLFTKFTLNSLWKRTKFTSGRKRKVKGKRTGERYKMPSIPSNAIRFTTVISHAIVNHDTDRETVVT